jgi:uncharacterized repeat protein (TIGR01451 family)
VGSGDPNYKSGPEGIGLERFIAQGQKLLYLIHFENLANATASAVNIVVTDRLDPNLDWETVTIGPTSPSNQASVQFDNTNGVITWTFANIDLPPNRNAPEGEGWVLFSVSPRWDLPSGTQLGNNATISFDQNPPMTTQQWTNTIDGTKPTSHVLPLTMVQANSTFRVRWSGSDTGSGILDYSMFVSENARPYTLWLASTNYTSANFTGKPNTSYSFYSIARDGTGNTESPPVTPDAETTTPAQPDTVGPTLSIPASITVEATAPSGAAVIYTASGLDDVDGSVPVSCIPPSGSTFPVGTSVVTCKATDKAGNTSASTFTVTVTKTGTVPRRVFDVTPQLFYGLTALVATLAILLAVVGVRRRRWRNRG